MLTKSDVVATIPAWDIERAKKFYIETLGFGPGEEDPGGVQISSGSTKFYLFPTMSGQPAGHTLASWEVDDIEIEVKELQNKGVKFEEYDMPGLKTENSIASIGDFRGAWFKDSEGNILSLGQRA
ncbi:MAG: VOC family protein [Actinomycetota bacterium]|nr:VOC family protein [Actinomycetota bacterium]